MQVSTHLICILNLIKHKVVFYWLYAINCGTQGGVQWYEQHSQIPDFSQQDQDTMQQIMVEGLACRDPVCSLHMLIKALLATPSLLPVFSTLCPRFAA